MRLYLYRGGAHEHARRVVGLPWWLPPLWLLAACVGCVVLGCNVCTLVPILAQRRGQIAAPKKIDSLVSYSTLGGVPVAGLAFSGLKAKRQHQKWIFDQLFR